MVLKLYHEVSSFVFFLIFDTYAPKVTSDVYHDILLKMNEGQKEIELDTKISDYLTNSSERHKRLVHFFNETYDTLSHRLQAYSPKAFVVAIEIIKSSDYKVIFSFLLDDD